MYVRALITGSRDWRDGELIWKLLEIGKRRCTRLTVVHGDCPTGADHIADLIAYCMDLPVEKFPADWRRHGRRAGYVRNAEMVKTKPDLCLAFIRNKSRGASMCADLAEKAGIPTHRYTEDQ